MGIEFVFPIPDIIIGELNGARPWKIVPVFDEPHVGVTGVTVAG